MSRRRPIAVVVLATVVATIGLTALPARAAQVSVQEYVRSVCTGIGDFQTTITDSQAAVESQLEDLTDIPSAKDAFLTFMGDFVGAVDQLRTDLKAAGTPQIENGGKLAAVLRTGVGQMHTLVQGAEDRRRRTCPPAARRRSRRRSPRSTGRWTRRSTSSVTASRRPATSTTPASSTMPATTSPRAR